MFVQNRNISAVYFSFSKKQRMTLTNKKIILSHVTAVVFRIFNKFSLALFQVTAENTHFYHGNFSSNNTITITMGLQ